MSSKLEDIRGRNLLFEIEAPYNFCDRWCKRCPHGTQERCRLYQDEFEQKITSLAHTGKEDDLDVVEEVLKWQYEGAGEALEEAAGRFGVDFEKAEEESGGGGDPFERRAEAARNDPLSKAAQQYALKAHEFLRAAFFGKEKDNSTQGLLGDFETVSWYHMLLAAKMSRALLGLRERGDEDDGEAGLCDAVAQLDVCKKAVRLSAEALKRIGQSLPVHRAVIVELQALLGHIADRIALLEEEI